MFVKPAQLQAPYFFNTADGVNRLHIELYRAKANEILQNIFGIY